MDGGISGGTALAKCRLEELSEADMQKVLDEAVQQSDAIRRLKELLSVEQLLSQLAKQPIACAAACLCAAFEHSANEGLQVLHGRCFHLPVCSGCIIDCSGQASDMLVALYPLQAGPMNRPASAELLRHADQIAAALHRDELLGAAMKLSGCRVAVHMLSWVCTSVVAESRLALVQIAGHRPCKAAVTFTTALSCFAGCDPVLEMHRQQTWTELPCSHSPLRTCGSGKE